MLELAQFMKITCIQTSFSNKSYQPKSPVFGIANSGKLKTLFTYGLPCMYTGIEIIDPKKYKNF